MKIVVAGGSAAGGFTALLLARAGHEVVVLEQDRLQLAPDVESAARAAFRPAAPQLVQPHFAMARCRQLLRQRLSDIYRKLLTAGVAEAPIRALMPGSLSDTAAWPGDDDLTMLMSRRSTIDWVLQGAVRAEPGITARYGVQILGLQATSGAVPRVTGVRTDQGDVPADLVVDATGRKSRLDSWLKQIGAQPAALTQAECGLAYFSRIYRLRRGRPLPGLATTRVLAILDEFTAGIWGGDNGTMQLAVAPLAADRRFRVLTDANVFTAVLRTVPPIAAWLDALEPVSGVFAMGGLHNTMRRLVVRGGPVATGLHAVGDSVCTTNPTFGRGLSVSLAGAADLTDTISAHPADLVAQALTLDSLAADHIVPFYADQAAIDGERLAMLRHAVYGAPLPREQSPCSGRITFAQLRMAASVDAAAFRGLWKIMGMTCKPADVYADPLVVARTRAALRNGGGAPTMVRPSRDQLRAALAGS
ncbi:MAG TPA: hypothetical protein VK836_23120 [Streptosporangiaceae bacterium]|nr:hypothetical protein [Streptosporangiaceae bacterium]